MGSCPYRMLRKEINSRKVKVVRRSRCVSKVKSFYHPDHRDFLKTVREIDPQFPLALRKKRSRA
jgi:hypothetical protein